MDLGQGSRAHGEGALGGWRRGDDDGEQGDDASSSEDSESDAESKGHVDAAVAGDVGESSGKQGAQTDPVDIADLQVVHSSESQADAPHQAQSTTAALETSLESLRAIGSLKAAQALERELKQERRRTRALLQCDPAVADAFSRVRRLEAQEALQQQRLVAQQNERKRAAAKAIADRNAAVAELKRTKKAIQDLEGTLASKHAIKSYTLESLGAKTTNGGGAKAKKNRFEVLDRLARLNAGLSVGQKNDWQWFKDAWDEKSGQKRFLHGCRVCWRTSVPMRSLCSCVPRQRASFLASRPCRCQGHDRIRSRGFHAHKQ